MSSKCDKKCKHLVENNDDFDGLPVFFCLALKKNLPTEDDEPFRRKGCELDKKPRKRHD